MTIEYAGSSFEDITMRRAIELTIEMWSDMQAKLGDNPDMIDRCRFKADWCREHGYDDENRPEHECFLCEYARRAFQKSKGFSSKCDHCPIIWPEHEFILEPRDSNDMMRTSITTPGCQNHRVDYLRAPLSDILDYLRDFNNWRCPGGGIWNG